MERLNQLVSALGEKAPEFDNYGQSTLSRLNRSVVIPRFQRGSFSSAAEFELSGPASNKEIKVRQIAG